MNKELVSEEFRKFTVETEIFLSDTMKIIDRIGEPLEGNSFYYHHTTTRFDDLLNKQINLFWTTRGPVKKFCEIGFNAGHSTYLFLIGNKTITDYTIFDLGNHAYTKPCFEFVKNYFKTVNFEFIEGDSITQIPKWIAEHSDQKETFDVVHVDGGHSIDCVTNDLTNAIELVKLGGLIIIDDTNISYINDLTDKYINEGYFEEINILPTTGYRHRIVKRIK
jgi:hypothetical protein